MTDPTPLDPEVLLSHATWVRPLARKLVFGDEARADDVVQEAWMRALQSPPRSEQALGSWLRTTVRNIAHHVRRGDRNRASRELRVARPEAEAVEADAVERVEQHQRLVSAVLTLDEPYRSTVILRFYDDLSTREIAERQGEREGTVRVRLKRALDRLREHFDREHDGDGQAWRAALLPLMGLPSELGAPTSASPGAAVAPAATLTAQATVGVLAMSAKKLSITAACAVVLSLLGSYVLLTALTGDESTVARQDPPPVDDRLVLGDGGVPTEAVEVESAATPAEPGMTGAPPAVVVGRVVFSDDQSPVADVEVRLTVQEGGQERYERVRTSEAGEYRYENAGAFTVPRAVAGFGPGSLTASAEPGLRVTEGAVAHIPDIAVERGGRVEGTVLDEAGVPVPDATVEAWCYSITYLDYEKDLAAQRSVTTDGSGRFVIDALGPDFVLVARAPGLVTSGRLNGIVRNGQEIVGLELELVSAAALTGRVVDADGEPVAGASVHGRPIVGNAVGGAYQAATAITGVYRGAPEALSTVTDADGGFRMPGAAPLPHALEVQADGFKDWIERVEPPCDVDVTLGAGGVLRGRITDRRGHPVPETRVRFFDADWGRGTSDRQAVSGADGEFVLSGLSPTPTGVLSVLAEGFAVHVVQPVVVEEKEAELSLTLDPGLEISGVVVDGDGNPVPLAHVVIEGDREIDRGDIQLSWKPTWEHGWGLSRTQTDTEGRFRFGSLYAGRFVVRAEQPGSTDVHVEVETDAGGEELELVLDPESLERVVLYGTVRDSLTGAPITEFNVTPMIPAEGGGLFGRGKHFENDDGEFEIVGLKTGSMALNVAAVGYSQWSIPVAEYDAGEHGFEVDLAPARTVRLRVLNEDGTPFVSGYVTFRDVDGRIISVETGPGALTSRLKLDSDGTGVGAGLPARTVRVLAKYSTGTVAGEFDLDLTTPREDVVELVLGAPTVHKLNFFICGSDEDLSLDVASLGRRQALSRLQGWMAEGKVWPVDRETVVATAGGSHGRMVMGTLTPTEDGGYEYHSGGFQDATPQPVLPVRLAQGTRALSVSAEGYAPHEVTLPRWREVLELQMQIVILVRDDSAVGDGE